MDTQTPLSGGSTTNPTPTVSSTPNPVSSTPSPVSSTPSPVTSTPSPVSPTPHFLVLHSETKKLSHVSPFLIAKSIQSIAGSVQAIKKLPSGDLLVQTSTNAQSVNLLRASKLHDIDVTVTPHNTLNTSRGVVYCPDLVSVPDSEIQQELSSQNVESVRRITIKREGQQVDTSLFVLTFSTPNLPSSINAGYLKVNVRPYIPNPLRCFRCQRFGHGQNSCRGSAACAKCGSAEHIQDDCTNEPHCVNCDGNHPAFVKSCPKWKAEKEIQRIKVVNNISYAEARKRASVPATPRPTVSYAAAVKSTSTVAIQTDSPTVPLKHSEPHRCPTCACQVASPASVSKAPAPSTPVRSSCVSPSSSMKKPSLTKEAKKPSKRPATSISPSSDPINSCSEHSAYEDEMEVNVTQPASSGTKKVTLQRPWFTGKSKHKSRFDKPKQKIKL